MFQNELTKIEQEFMKGAAFQYVSAITQYHRIQASPGFRQAAHYVCSTLQDLGIAAEVISFPAKPGVTWWCESSFQEWDCLDAELVLLDDKGRIRLCSYRENKLSLIQRSQSTDPQGVEAEVIYIEKGEEPNSYEDVDVKDKIVFSRGNPSAIARLAVKEHGALGIILDNMTEIPPIRSRLDLPDARQYTSFWPLSEADNTGFGFVLSPRQGEMLLNRFTSGEKVKVYAKVDARFYDGEIEVVSACIPGVTTEEVAAIAHLCHPQPSANDNASGSGTLIETARVLNTLIQSGELAKPQRTIRFLWVPEMTGTYAYLSANENRIGETVAAINLDMVGENQELCKGPLIVEKPPRATRGFGGYLAESILRYMAMESSNLGGTSSYALFKWAVSPYSGGSDHSIWSDPSVGISCPMTIQWPDKYYHTSEDSIDKVDPHMLKLVGTITATYLYFSANMNFAQALWMAHEIISLFPGEIKDVVTGIVKNSEDPVESGRAVSKRSQFLKNRCIEDIKSLENFLDRDGSIDDILAQAEPFLELSAKGIENTAFLHLSAKHGIPVDQLLSEAHSVCEDEWDKKAQSIIPKRLFKGPLSSRTLNLLTPEMRERMEDCRSKWKKEWSMFEYFIYWIDGENSIFDIADLIEGEIGKRNTQALVEYFEILRDAGLLEVN